MGYKTRSQNYGKKGKGGKKLVLIPGNTVKLGYYYRILPRIRRPKDKTTPQI